MNEETKLKLLKYIEEKKWTEEVAVCECCGKQSIEILNAFNLENFIKNLKS